jgi:hypothetical protein
MGLFLAIAWPFIVIRRLIALGRKQALLTMLLVIGIFLAARLAGLAVYTLLTIQGDEMAPAAGGVTYQTKRLPRVLVEAAGLLGTSERMPVHDMAICFALFIQTSGT